MKSIDSNLGMKLPETAGASPMKSENGNDEDIPDNEFDDESPNQPKSLAKSKNAMKKAAEIRDHRMQL